MKRHHQALLTILKDTGLDEHQVDLVAALSAVLDLQHAMLSQKFDEMLSILQELSSRLKSKKRAVAV